MNDFFKCFDSKAKIIRKILSEVKYSSVNKKVIIITYTCIYILPI